MTGSKTGKKKKGSQNYENLRKVAEEVIKKSKGDLKETSTKFKGMLEELRIYQVELEIQKEELLKTGLELEEMGNKYESLYEFAPCGYLTLNSKKEILEANNKAATLLGIPKERLVGENLVTFIAPEDQPRLVKYYKQIKRATGISGLKVHNHPPGALHVELETYFECRSKGSFYQTTLIDCSERIITEQRLDKQQRQLKINIKEVHDKNTALQELLSQVETGKTKIQEAVTFNAEKLLIPLVKRLREKENKKSVKTFELLEKNIKQITSQFGLEISGNLVKLSIKEIEICNMVRSGFSSKEIASSFEISLKTVETHRRNIRKKLNIENKEVNLTSYLNSI